MKTLQEVFDLAVSRTLSQGRKSQESEPRPGRNLPMCLYRGPGGVCCPVGHVILDEFYDPEIEGAEVFSVPGSVHPGLREALNLSGVPDEAFSMLSALQVAHDETPVEEWPEAFNGIAADLGLRPTVIDEFLAQKGEEG